MDRGRRDLRPRRVGAGVVASAALAVGLGAACGPPGKGEAHRPARRADAATTVVPTCPDEMSQVGESCVDRWEAGLVEVGEDGREAAHSPFRPVDGRRVRAVSRPGAIPQGYVSAVEAQGACREAGKRLCRADEWRAACEGPGHGAWGYGPEREPGRCNDRGKSGILKLHGRAAFSSFSAMNDPAVNQQEGTLAPTGQHTGCTNEHGVFDMIGNLHEWVEDGTFHGGYYLDVTQNGRGCAYVTRAHLATYHDYSTGFRCCRDLAPSRARRD